MQKVRKTGGERQGGFLGAEVILPQITNGANRKRVGFTVDGKAPVRAHTELFDSAGNKIGECRYRTQPSRYKSDCQGA